MSWSIRLPVKEDLAGSIPAPGADGMEGQANWRWQPSRKRPSDEPWGFDSLPFRFRVDASLAERQRHRSFIPRRRVRLPGDALGDRLTGRLLGFEPTGGGSNPPPRILNLKFVHLRFQFDPGQLLLVVTPHSECGGRWFDSSPRNSVRFDQWPGRQPADHSRSDREMLRVRIPPGPLTRSTRPRGAAWSARHTVKVETVGSNPTGGADLT
jgi:hypothetical protein